MKIQCESFQFHVHPISTRFPFRYGIASMTEVPYLFVNSRVIVDGVLHHGLSADGLPPKWFTKDPHTTFDSDLAEMYRVIRHAAELACQPNSVPFFSWWQNVYDGQQQWANAQRLAPLLANLGTSLIERSVIDAICRAQQVSLHQLLQSDLLAIALVDVRPSLTGVSCQDFLPSKPADAIHVRHAVGLADPITDADIPLGQALNDGLPQSLVAAIREYGLRYFKIKLCGDVEQDRERLQRLATVIQAETPDAKITLDGNENFSHVEEFKEHFSIYRSVPVIRDFLTRSLLFVEQPVHRDRALDENAKKTLDNWSDHPPFIIDESDGELASLPLALELGYSGTSHKNCKGIVKGLANAATLASHRKVGRSVILSAEDLGNVGPVALLQDYAVVAALGITHVERNGHHYYRGLSMFPLSEQQRTLKWHGDLYRLHESGFCTQKIESGRVNINSVNSAPFGFSESPDLSQFKRLD